MNDRKRMTLIGGLAAVVAGIALIGTTGVAFAIGWLVWLVGLVAVLGAVGEPSRQGSVADLGRVPAPAGVGDRQAA